MADERDVVRFHRFAEKLHVSIFERAIPFAVIAGDAGSYQIFPRVLPLLCFGDDMINRKGHLRFAAILAAVPITAKNVLARQDNLLVRNLNVDTEADDAREWHRHGYGADLLSVVRFDEFGLPEEEKDDRLFDVADAHRFVVLIEDQNLVAKPAGAGAKWLTEGYTLLS